MRQYPPPNKQENTMEHPKSLEASAHVVHSDCRPTIEVSVPSGTQFKDLVSDTDWLIDLVRKLGPRGCEPCLSGRDILIRERFEEIVNVAIPQRG